MELLRPDLNLLETVADVLDEPFADASVLPTYFVSQMARQQVTVALSGDGGDELFAGYDWYLVQKFAAQTVDYLPESIHEPLSAFAAYIPPTEKNKSLRNISRRFLQALSLPQA